MIKSFLSLFLLLQVFVAYNQNFTEGNLVVFRTGSGAAALSLTAAKVYLDEYTPTGAFIQSLAMPSTASGANKALLVSGNSTTDGQINLSANKKYILVPGYSTTEGAANPASVSSLMAPRVVGTVTNDKVINTATSLDVFSGASFRTVASANGTDFYLAGGSTGTVSATLNSTSTTIISNTITNSRALKIFNGNLYLSNASFTNVRIGKIATGLPTTTGNTTVGLPGIPNSGTPTSFLMLDLSPTVPGLDVLYIADEFVGILKYSLVGTNWVSNGNISSAGVKGLTGSNTGNAVKLFATNSNQIITVADNGGYNVAPTTLVTSVLATAPSNTEFSGIAFTPEPLTVTRASSATTSNAIFNVKTASSGTIKDEVKVFIDTRVNSDALLIIYDTAGKIVTQRKIRLNSGDNIITTNTEALKAGSYVLHITQLNKKGSIKFIKQ